MPAPTSCLQHSTGATLTHFSSGWIQGEMLVEFLFRLLLYLHLLFYSITTDKNKSVLREAAQMEALRVRWRVTSIRDQLQARFDTFYLFDTYFILLRTKYSCHRSSVQLLSASHSPVQVAGAKQ